MKELFAARNKLRECSLDSFADYIDRTQNNLTLIDYTNLLQQAFNLYKNKFVDYLRILHSRHKDIVFAELQDGKRKVSVLEQIARYGRSWEFEDLIEMEPRITKDFSLQTLVWAISNVHNQKDPKNAYEIVHMILKEQPSIILDPIQNDSSNPLIQSLNKQLYDVAKFLLTHDCYILPTRNYSSNELHYLFSGKPYRKHHQQMLSLAQLLINKRVDPYQKDQHGKTAIDLCHSDIKDQFMKIVKSKGKGVQNNPSSEMYQKSKNAQKAVSRYSGNNNGGKNYRDEPTKHYNEKKMRQQTIKQQRLGKRLDQQPAKDLDKSSSGNSLQGVISSKNIYKGRVRSQFGGKKIIKQNNELLRINIQNNNLSYMQSGSHASSINSMGESHHVVRICNYEELENEATMIFQRHVVRKEEQFVSQRVEFQREAKEKRHGARVLQNEELKYYLREEIIELTDSIKKTNQAQRPGYTRIFSQIKRTLQQKIPLIKVDIFGSFATNLHLDLSDIDIVIVGRQGLREVDSRTGVEYEIKYEQRRVHEIFQCVCNQLMGMQEFIQEVTYLDKASIPIIKATCRKEYDFKNIDISFQDQQHKGIDSVQLIKDYLARYPQLNNLMLVLKKFIYETKLFSPYTGGLSSYGLFLMAVALIQNQQFKAQEKAIVEGYQCSFTVQNKTKNVLQNNLNITNLEGQKRNVLQHRDIHLRTAQLLINFFKFYGFKMDFVTQKIMLNKPNDNLPLKNTINYNHEWQNQFPPQPKLIIMDPLYEQNNVGKATRRIKEIKMAFQLAFIAIHTNKRCQTKKTCPSYKRIKSVKMQQVRFKQNKRPCCILQRMFRCTDNFNLQDF